MSLRTSLLGTIAVFGPMALCAPASVAYASPIDCTGCIATSTSSPGVQTDPISGVQISLEIDEDTSGLCIVHEPSENCLGVQACTYEIEWSINAGPCGTSEGEARFRVSGSGALPGSTPAGTITIPFGALGPGQGNSGTIPLGLDCGGAAEGIISLLPACDPGPNTIYSLTASAQCSSCTD